MKKITTGSGRHTARSTSDWPRSRRSTTRAMSFTATPTSSDRELGRSITRADCRGQRVELGEIVGTEAHCIGAYVVFEKAHLIRARDRDHVVALCEYPRQGHLRQGHLVTLRNFSNDIDDLLVRNTRLDGEARVYRPHIVG